MSLPRRISIVVFAIALVGALSSAPAATAAGGSLSTSTSVSIQLGIDGFHGRTSSAKPTCERNRKVTLYRLRSGVDKALGSDRSGITGEWAIDVPLSPGPYYVKVAATPDAKVLTSCEAGRSRRVVLD